jgi:Tol biopolymer transport system component
MGVTGGQVSRFLSIEYQIWDHDWSPDGKRIVFHELRADNRVDLWLCDASGSGLRNLTGHLEGRYGRPTWSPDSELITFAAMLNSTYGVFTMEISSGEIHKVTDLQVWNYCFPMWSRTDRIVYSDRLPNGQVHAFSVAPNGGNKRCLTLGLKVQGVVWPSLSPSGEFLLFRENWGSDSRPMLLHLSTGQLSELSQAGKYPQWHPSGRYIYIGTADGEFRNLWRTEIHPETGREMSEPEMIEATRNMNVTRYAFSPDGDRILFSTMLQQGDLWLFPTDTAGIMDLTSGQQLTQDDYHDSSPDFLDESDSVLFHSNRGQAGALWTLNLKDAAAPTSFPLPGGFEACWGPSVIPPDGTWFAFHHSDQHLPEQPYLMRPDGSEIHPLGSSIGDVFDSLSVEHITLRDCSADGRRMVFDFYRGGSEMEMALGSFDPETGLLRYFEPILGVDGQDPRFSPDGQAIAYESDRLGSYDVWTMRIDPPGIPEPVTYSGDRERIVGWSEDPSFIYYVIPQDVEFGLRSSVWRVPMDSDNKPSGEPELWQVFPMYMHIAGIDFYEDTAVLSITSRETAFWLLEFN